MLEEYGRFPLFRTVGIDSTFYAPPTEETLEGWARYLPPGFPCVSKVWDQITVQTHAKARNPGRAGQANPDFLNPDVFLEAVYQPYQRHFADHTGPFVFEFNQQPDAGAIQRRLRVGVESGARQDDDKYCSGDVAIAIDRLRAIEHMDFGRFDRRERRWLVPRWRQQIVRGHCTHGQRGGAHPDDRVSVPGAGVSRRQNCAGVQCRVDRC